MDWIKKLRAERSAVPTDDDLETVAERKERWRSINAIYFTMFLMSLGFSIILTGVWPYLDKVYIPFYCPGLRPWSSINMILEVVGEFFGSQDNRETFSATLVKQRMTLDKNAGKEFMGYVVAANPLAQMLFSPFVGWWGDKRGSIRLPLLTTLALFTFASGLYSVLEILPGDKKMYMIAARFLVGVSSANIAAARSYLSAATKFVERTHAVSMVSLAQVLGFVVGPGLQAAVTPLGEHGFYLINIPFNMYTMTGWINVIMGILNFSLFLPWNFKEHRIALREAMKSQGRLTEEETLKSVKPDYLANWTLICAFFVLVFNFVLLETLGTSLTMDQFGWSKKESLYYMGLLMSVGAIVSCITFVMIEPLCKRFNERKVMLWGGFFLMIIGRILYIPWGPDPPPIAYEPLFDNGTTDVNATEVLGCPSTQEWCLYTPQLTVTQFFIGYGFTTIGYPLGVTLIQTIFSKVLGPRPQGVWMGFMTGAGCASRVLGPVFVSVIYTRYGTYHTFGVTGLMLILSMLWLQIVDKRLVPPKLTSKDETKPDAEIPLVHLKYNDSRATNDIERNNINAECDKV